MRFESTQTPLARAIIRHRANIDTAIQIARARKGETEAVVAEYFLMYVSGAEGLRRMLLLGMLADAGDESACLVRHRDVDLSDSSEVSYWVAAYVRRCQFLFLEGGCLQTGFTQVILQILRKPVVYVVRGTSLQCGSQAGATAADAEWALSHMKSWFRLAVQVLRSEFPEFTVLAAFSVFRLAQDDLRGRHKGDSVVQSGDADEVEKLETLAATFRMDPQTLAGQFLRVRRVAQAVSRPARLGGDRESWRAAVLRFPKKQVREVATCVKAWLGWEPGSGGIERAFAQYHAFFAAARRTKISRQREQDVLTLITDYNSKQVDAVVVKAIEIWTAAFFNVRGNRNRTYVVAGPRRRVELGKPTLNQFFAKRRRTVEALTKSSGVAVVSAAELRSATATAWTPAMTAEEDHQKNKRAHRLVEACAQGSTPPARLLNGMSPEEIVDLYTANEGRLQKDRDGREMKKRAVFAPRAHRALQGKAVKWLPPGAAAGASRACLDAIQEMHLTNAATVRTADLVAVLDLRDFQGLAKWEVYLRGGSVCQAEYLASRGASGACLTFKPATRARRWQLWTSAAWVAQQPREFLLLQQAAGDPGSKWTWFVGNAAEFLARALRVKSVMGIVTDAEYQAFPRDVANVKTSAGFLQEVVEFAWDATDVATL